MTIDAAIAEFFAAQAKALADYRAALNAAIAKLAATHPEVNKDFHPLP